MTDDNLPPDDGTNENENANDNAETENGESAGDQPIDESPLEKVALKEERVLDLSIEEEMKRSYLTYAMSVIVSRALPDVADGLKPSQRRILVAMNDLNLSPRAKYRKCAKIAGDTSGNYHPHGEQVVYPTLVRMAQPWNLRYPLIDGQGNFGSIDPDPPAAMRYTESRMMPAATAMLEDLDKDTVDMIENYDETRFEPVVLPSKFPNLLVNGSQGIAVGMATNLAPNNITEVINSLKYLIDNPDCSIKDLMFVSDNPAESGVQGPDFPTGGIICGRSGIRQAYMTGRGRVILRARTNVEESRNSKRIVVTEIPYQIGKERLIEKIVECVKDGRIEGISDLRDESSRKGLRIVIELKRNEDPDVVLNQLFKFTPLQSTFSIINIALVNGRPRTLTIKQLMEHYLLHRRHVIRRRTRYLLSKAEQAAHLSAGQVVAIDFIDRIIEIIRASDSPADAREKLVAAVAISPDRAGVLHAMLREFLSERDDGMLALSEKQATEILNMRLRRLTALERTDVLDRFGKLMDEIIDYRDILAREERILNIIRNDLDEIKKTYGDARRTEIGDPIEDIDDIDLIADDTMVVTISRAGFIKREPLGSYRLQGRGGKGLIGQKTSDEDITEQAFVSTMHQYILCFTNDGKVHWLRVYRIPQMGRTARGRNLVNLLQLGEGQRVVATVPVRGFDEDASIVLYSKNNYIKKVPLSAYGNPRTSGIITMKIEKDDELLFAAPARRGENILLCTRFGMTIRVEESVVRDMGRTARGINGPTLTKQANGEMDRVVALRVGHPNDMLLTVCEKGVGKRSRIEDYRRVGSVRAKGVINMKITEKNGPVVDCRIVKEDDEIMIISKRGMIIRARISDISVLGRATQGVYLMRLNDDDVVAGLARVSSENLEQQEQEIIEEQISKRMPPAHSRNDDAQPDGDEDKPDDDDRDAGSDDPEADDNGETGS